MMFRVLAWLAASICALWMGWLSFVIVNESNEPNRALAASFGRSDMASGWVSLALGQAGQMAGDNAAVKAHAHALASQAYRGEPLAIQALVVLSMEPSAGVNKDRKRELLSAMAAIDRRNPAHINLQIDAAGRRGSQAEMTQWLSRGMLTNPVLRENYSVALAQMTARADAVRNLSPLLGNRPAWGSTYWRAVATMPGSVANAGRLRLALAGSPWNQRSITDEDRGLVRALASSQNFAIATDVAQALGGRTGGRNSLVLAGSGADAKLLAPVGWDLTAKGELGASVDPRTGQLSVSALGGASGVVAQRLVKLDASSYRLRSTLSAHGDSQPDMAQATPLAMRIRCAESGKTGAPDLVFPLEIGQKEKSVSTASAGCTWYWLSLEIDLGLANRGADMTFDKLTLSAEPAGSVPRAE